MNVVTDFIHSQWASSRRVKLNNEGWLSGNACCCIHNGETADSRGRGGLIVNTDDAVSYSCFNCNYKASYQPGRHLSFKMRKLLAWMGVSELDIKRMVIEAIRVKDIIGETEPEKITKEEIKFDPKPLPPESVSYLGLCEFAVLGDKALDSDIVDCIEYVDGRKINLQNYEFYFSPEKKMRIYRRVIIPFTWNNEIIGYTARAIDDKIKPKYLMNVDSHYVFNTDKQQKDWKFVIVCEGPFDAMAVDGVAVLHNMLHEQQIDIIDSLHREVIVVPDNDKSGIAIINQAVECGWSVSFPIWFESKYECKDINDAVKKFGKLFVLKSILDAKETSKLKIEILTKRLNKVWQQSTQ